MSTYQQMLYVSLASSVLSFMGMCRCYVGATDLALQPSLARASW